MPMDLRSPAGAPLASWCLNPPTERETGAAEQVTREEKQEMGAFKDAVCRTPVMRFVLEYLKVTRGTASGSAWVGNRALF